MEKGKLVLIIGPSGVGKSVILKKLRKKHPKWHFPRSATTRRRRDGEGDELYRFVTDDEFDQLINGNNLLEWAVVHEGARYGTPINEIIPFIEAGKIVIREVDVQGFDAVQGHDLFNGDGAKYMLQSIFIFPENKDQLIRHIKNRASIDEAELKRRVESMEKELSYAELCDVRIKNIEGKLEQTIADVEKAVIC